MYKSPAHSQLTNTVLMVRPTDFDYNPETAGDNEFQHQGGQNGNAKALAEFEQAVQLLRAEGIRVLVLEKTPGSSNTPDAVFPNNWFATAPGGTVLLFPMLAPNRRAERDQYPAAEALLRAKGLPVKKVISVGPFTEDSRFLEGTGSMVIDHENAVVYAALGVRTHAEQLQNFCNITGYSEPVTFITRSSSGKPFYHTNVVMSIGKGFAVVCPSVIPDPNERTKVLSSLRRWHEVIELSTEQTEKSFCANLLCLKKPEGSQLVVMSDTAFNGFTEGQRSVMEKYGKLLALPIPTIEHIGGGSARCMLAEVFLAEPED